MVSAKIARNKNKGPEPGHVIHTLISEHEIILSFLERLEKLNEEIQKNSFNKETFKNLKDIAFHLIKAEPHHQREEQVLFPELEKRGVFGPTEIMRREHEDLRPRKKELLRLSKDFQKIEFDNFKEKLNEITNFLTSILGEHIYKENNILYPMAVELIEEKVWQKMKNDCDKIGYCCFTPLEVCDS